jgi:hypothetical protein
VTQQHNGPEVIVKNVTRKPKAAKAPTKPKAQPHACECDCGGTTVTGRARFIPGHDAKLASRLVTAALEGDKAAERRLGKLGWQSKLDASRRSREAKAARKAAKAAKSEPKEADQAA